MNLPHVLLPRPHRLSRASFSLGGASLGRYHPTVRRRAGARFTQFENVVLILRLPLAVEVHPHGNRFAPLWDDGPKQAAGGQRLSAHNSSARFSAESAAWA